MTRATTRTCDAMGVCQGHAQPCNGCMLAPRRSHRICSADQCQQGCAACPCPTACEVPEPDALQDEPMTTAEAALLWAIAALAALVVSAVTLASVA